MKKCVYYLPMLLVCILFSACSSQIVKNKEIVISGKPLPLITGVYLDTSRACFSGTFEYSAAGDFSRRNGWCRKTAGASFTYPEILANEVKKTIQKAFENEISSLNPPRNEHTFTLELSLGKSSHQAKLQVETAYYASVYTVATNSTANNVAIPYNTYFVDIQTELCYRLFSPGGQLVTSGITMGEGGGRGVNTGCANDSYAFERAYKAAFEVAVHEACMKLVDKLVTSPEVDLEKRKIHMQKTLPANLTADIKFSDVTSLIPNNTIDAGEESIITVFVTNEGKGTAFDVMLNAESSFKNIHFKNAVAVGDILPGEKKEIPIVVTAGLDIESGTALFLITCKEKRGYDSTQYRLAVPASCLDKPELLIAEYKIEDSSTGFAVGNGNGIPENGETIEVIPFIKNNGKGKAINVNLSIASSSSGISIKRKEMTIPQILQGQTVTGNLVLSIPATFSEKSINITLSVSDVRGVSNTTQPFTIRTETYQPALAYTYEIIGNNKKGVLENGKPGELVIRTINKGQMDAKDVSIHLQSGDVKLSNTTAGIPCLPVNVSNMSHSFFFDIPRTFEKKLADINIRLEQKDFRGLTDTIHLPVKLVQPDLVIAHHFLDANNNGSIEQGESIELIITVKNQGELDAEDVTLRLLTDQQGTIRNGIILNCASKKESIIGRIQAGRECEAGRFLVDVRRGADIGSIPIKFTISQKDFKGKDDQIFLNVVKEQPVNITVEPLKMTTPVAIVDTNTPPLIAIGSHKDNEKVISDTVLLEGSVSDDRGISNVEIKVNNRLVDAADLGLVIEGKADTNPMKRHFSQTINLTEGKNVIKVTAFDTNNCSSSETVTVFRDRKQGAIWAVVIGIDYKGTQISPLKYAKNDAVAFAEYLRKTWNLDKDHLLELYDEQATQVSIRSHLGETLPTSANKPEDTVFIFFAGHGAPEVDTGSLDNDGITKYIIAYDSVPDKLFSTAVPMDDIAKIFNRIRAERIVFIIDCCYSGGSGGRTLFAPGRRFAMLSDGFLSRMCQGKGRIIITSCNASETSSESDELKHGYFTYYLLEGLKGKADSCGDGSGAGDKVIDIGEILSYISKHVPKATKNAQHPVIKGEVEGQVIIGRVK